MKTTKTRMSVTVESRDLGQQALQRRLRALTRRYIDVGVQGLQAREIHGDGPSTTGEVAWDSEYGTGRVPPRPFLSQAFATKGWGNDLHRAAQSVIDGLDTEVALQGVADKAVADVQETISSGNFAPNAPGVVARKGGDTPLIATGQLLSSITAVIKGRVSRTRRKSGFRKTLKKIGKRARKLSKSAAKGGRRLGKKAARTGRRLAKAGRTTARRASKSVRRTGKRAIRGTQRVGKRASKKVAKIRKRIGKVFR